MYKITTVKPIFNGIEEASQYCDGIMRDWDWFDGFDWDELCLFMSRESDGKTLFSDLLARFLIKNGQNPDDYDVDGMRKLEQFDLYEQKDEDEQE